MAHAFAVAALASAVTVLVAIVRSKVTAVVLGPEGLGMAAEVLQLVTLVMVPLGIVTGPAFVRAISAARGDSTSRQHAYDVTATLVVTGGLSLVALASVIGIGLFSGSQVAWFAFLGATGFLATVFVTLPCQILMIEGDTRKYAFVSAVTAAATGVTVALATIAAGLTGQFVAMAVVPFLLGAVWWRYYRRTLPMLRIRPRLRLDQDLVREMVLLGGASLVSSVTLQGALSAIRLVLAHNGGPVANGHFQAAWAIGAGYFLVVQQGLASVIFPRYAGATNAAELQREVVEAGRFVFKVAPPLILTAIAFRDVMTRVLYSGRFGLAATMVGFLMAGDLAKAIGAVHAGPLLLQGKIRAFLITESIAAALLGGLPAILIPMVGPIGAAYGYAITYMVYVVVTWRVVQSACGIAVGWTRTLWAIIFGTAASMAVALAGDSDWLKFVLLLVAAVWIERSGGLTNLRRLSLAFLRPAS